MSPVLAHWSAVWPAAAIYLAVAGAHLAGTLRGGLGGAAGRRAVISEAALFQGGLLLALLAIVSPLRYWSGIYIWVRAIQDLVLAIVAPGLIVVGAPWPALARSVGRRQIGQRAPDGPAAGLRRPWWLRWPLATVVAFNVIWLGWHLPALFDKVPASAAAGGPRVRALPRRGHPVLAAAHRVAAMDTDGPADAPGRAAGRHRGRGHHPRHGAGLRLRRASTGTTATPRIT